MKIFCLIILLLAAAGGILRAQTNGVAPKAPRKTVITSHEVFYNNGARRVTYSGHVQVEDAQMKMTCEQLIAFLPKSGGHIDHMVALTNVVIDSVDEKGDTNRATSDKAIYDYKLVNGVTNETVTLTGNARVDNKDNWVTGEPIIWDRANNTMHATNQRMQFRQSITSAMAGTNAPAAGTNLPPTDARQTNSHVATTNFPPGTFQNTNRMNLQKPVGPTK